MTSNNLVMTIKNQGNTVAVIGAVQYSLKDIIGLAAPSLVKGLITNTNGFTITGTGIAGIDLRDTIAVGDTINAHAKFFATASVAAESAKTYTVSAITATQITVTGGTLTAVTAADLNTAAGDTATFLISKASTNTFLSDAVVGSTLEFGGSGSNNKVFEVVSISPNKRSAVLSGNVVTEAVSGALSVTLRATTTAAEASCTVSEVMQGTKESSTCSGRGSCDGSSGTCTCYSGYTGESCDQQIQEM